MSVESIEASTLVVDHIEAHPGPAAPAPTPSAPAVSDAMLLARELGCGTIAGMAQVMSGQPVSRRLCGARDTVADLIA